MIDLEYNPSAQHDLDVKMGRIVSEKPNPEDKVKTYINGNGSDKSGLDAIRLIREELQK